MENNITTLLTAVMGKLQYQRNHHGDCIDPKRRTGAVLRIANLSGRLVLITEEGTAVDVENASGAVFSADPQAVYARWAEFRAWAADADLPPGTTFDATDLGSPAPAPRQVLAIGLNYRDHASESGFTAPEGLPPVFTKFATSITGPVTDLVLPTGGPTRPAIAPLAVH